MTNPLCKLPGRRDANTLTEVALISTVVRDTFLLSRRAHRWLSELTSRRILQRQDGNALIETALILPVLILMLLLVLDFGVILNLDLRVADSARSAAESTTLRLYAGNPTNAQLVANLSAGGIPNYSVAAVNYCTCANGAGTASCNDHTSCGTYGIPNQYMKVTATATLPLLFGVKGFPASINVQSVAIARTVWTGTN